jgi:hypothetical protein
VSVAASLIHGTVSPIVLFPPSAGLAGGVGARAILKLVLRFFYSNKPFISITSEKKSI